MGGVVLLVEDALDVRSVFVQILEREGFRVLEAGDGREAIVLANARPVDAIVMDVSLPMLDGIEATRILRSSGKLAVPIIGVTGRVLGPAEREVFDRVLTKPCMPDALVLCIRSLISRSRSPATKR